jgi:hypothetical protein
MDFKGDKIRSTPSFGEEVKPSVTCRRFTACKRTLRAWKYARRQNSAAMFLTRVSTASLLDVYGGFTTRCLWWSNQDDYNQVDHGADNPHRNTITKPVREAKARLWAVATLMMMIMIFIISVVFNSYRNHVNPTALENTDQVETCAVWEWHRSVLYAVSQPRGGLLITVVHEMHRVIFIHWTFSVAFIFFNPSSLGTENLGYFRHIFVV